MDYIMAQEAADKCGIARLRV